MTTDAFWEGADPQLLTEWVTHACEYVALAPFAKWAVTIEIPQYTRIFKANNCLKVHNVVLYLKLALPIPGRSIDFVTQYRGLGQYTFSDDAIVRIPYSTLECFNE